MSQEQIQLARMVIYGLVDTLSGSIKTLGVLVQTNSDHLLLRASPKAFVSRHKIGTVRPVRIVLPFHVPREAAELDLDCLRERWDSSFFLRTFSFGALQHEKARSAANCTRLRSRNHLSRKRSKDSLKPSCVAGPSLLVFLHGEPETAHQDRTVTHEWLRCGGCECIKIGRPPKDPLGRRKIDQNQNPLVGDTPY